jgi:hypothetical protein
MSSSIQLDTSRASTTPDVLVPTPRQWKKRLPQQDAAQRYNGFRFAIPDYKTAPQVVDIFELNREEEQKRKNSIEYRLESYLEMWDVVICIEHCHNCDNHGASLRHNAAKYVDNAILFQKHISRVIFNCGYSIRVGVVRLHLTNESRIGAFEVDIYCRSRLTYAHAVLHSKLLTLQWPTKRSIETELLSFLGKLNLPRWKSSAGVAYPAPTESNNILSEDFEYPPEYGVWENLAPADSSWVCPVQDVIGEFSHGPDTPIAVEWVFDNRQSQPFHPVVGGYCRVAGLPSAKGGVERLSLLAFVTETHTTSPDHPFEDCIKVKLKYSGQEYAVPISACCELNEYTPLRAEYGADEFPEELALVLLFLMASRNKPIRLKKAFGEEPPSTRKASVTPAGNFFDENAPDHISPLHHISNEMRKSTGGSELTNKSQRLSPRSSPRGTPKSSANSTPQTRSRAGSSAFFPDNFDATSATKSANATSFVASPESTTKKFATVATPSNRKNHPHLSMDADAPEISPWQYSDEWTPLSENDKEVFEKVFLCRASLFTQLREKVAQLESVVLTDSNIAGTVYHPISGNFVDLQQAYSEEVLNWLFARYSIADMYQLEDIVARLYMMVVDEFVNCNLDQVAPKYAYKLQCFLLRHCIRDRWLLIASSNHHYRKLIDNVSSISTEECLLLTVKFVRSTMHDLCEFMAGLRQRPDDWLSRVPYVIGALDGRGAGSIVKTDLRQALEFLNVPDRILNEEYINAIFLSMGK